MTYKIGSRGEIVKQIQKALTQAGFGVMVDGVFGPITQEAVIAFQKSKGLTADGIVGPATMAKLIPPATASVFGLKRSKRIINEIIVHCSDTPAGKDFTVEDIRRWHTLPPPKGRGWSDIGYHYVIYRDGTVHNGRDVDLIGAHCTNHNAHSIGVCYIGGRAAVGTKSKDTRTAAQRMALKEFLIELKRLYPNAKIYGHRDFAAKECPSFDAKAEYSSL